MWTVSDVMTLLLFVHLLLFCGFSKTSGAIVIPRLNGLCYSRQGDVQIALLQEISASGSDKLCSEELASIWKPQYVESFKFAIDEVNTNPDILPNITLGFVVADVCNKDLVALSRALSFISSEEGNSNTTGERTADFGVDKVVHCGEELVSFDVVGVVGPDTSREAVMVSSLLSLFEIPVLSTYASSDELTDQSRFEYFMRLVPPDRLQAQAMMDILEHYGWTYVSLLFSEGSYGENGAKHIEKEAKARGICIEYNKKISQDDNRDAYDTIIDNLLKHSKARVVVMFVGETPGAKLFHFLNMRKIKDYFIWISADAMSYDDFGPSSNGMFTMLYTMGMTEPFRLYYSHLVPDNSSGNPWMLDLWTKYYNCEWNEAAAVSCEDYRFVPKVEQEVTTWASKQYDGVWVFAHALHALILDRCPRAFQDPSVLRTCIEGKVLLSFMKNVTFQGMSGKITFDKTGDMMGEYDLFQFVYDHEANAGKTKTIGMWDKSTEKLILYEEQIEWDFFSVLPGSDVKVSGIPESVCSKPCKEREFAVQKELKCCWECMTCRNNEFIVNNSKCDVCEENTWPDDQNATTCELIRPTYMRAGEPISIGLLTLTSVGIVAQAVIAILFYKHRNSKLIKASGRELTSIIALGILIGYMTVFAKIAKPTTVLCHISHFGFNFAVTLIYAPLLLKTNRVYRIFTGGKHGTKALNFIGSTSQIVMALLLLLIQVRKMSLMTPARAQKTFSVEI